MSRPARVWVTRAQPGADRTAERLRALAMEPLVRPLLAIQPLSPALPDLDRFSALAFTSINGVEAFARLTARRDRPVFAVGDATARAAREADFGPVVSADGDLGALARRLAEAATGPVLALTAETPAGDLAEAARGAGGRIPVETLTVYRAVETAVVPPEAFDAVLVHSPRAGRALAALTAPPDGAVAVCISEAAAAPLRALGRDCAVAPAPHEAALLATLQAALGKRDPRV